MMWLSCCKIGMVTLAAADFAHFSSICRHSKDITSYINFAPADHDDGYHGGNHDNGSKFLLANLDYFKFLLKRRIGHFSEKAEIMFQRSISEP